jgi:predicted metal-dependent enzyme (double-stranded beta helix superfamily)
MESTPKPSPTSIGEFVRRLREYPESVFLGTQEVFEFLLGAPVDPETLRPYLTWDRRHYTRNLIDRTPHYELLAVCWEAGQISSVHNHRNQNCWMTVPMGRLRVENYRVHFEDLEKGTCRLEAADTLEMSPERPSFVDPRQPVHRVVNPADGEGRAVSLHIYSRPFHSCMVYSPEQGTCGEIRLNFNTEFGEPVGR